MRRFAPAKINIGLRLLNRRPDGYHAIETILHTLDWGDDVSLKPAEGISLEVVALPDAPNLSEMAQVPVDESNLAWKAADLVLRELNLPGVSIRIEKRIPPGAGLGGGSSDAAAVLAGIAELYGRQLPDGVVAELAFTLGADVPFFLRGGCALAQGVGEDLTRLSPMPQTDVIVAFPPVSVSTAWAYETAKYTLTRSGEYEDYLKSVEGVIEFCSPSILSNDLEQAVVSAHPAIADHLSALRQTDSFFVSMTGSGSAVYGLYDGTEAAEMACRGLKAMGVSAIHTTLT